LRKAATGFVMSVCVTAPVSVRPRGTPQFPLDGFLWNWIFEFFSKICRKGSIIAKI